MMNSYQALQEVKELPPVTQRNPVTTFEKITVGVNASIGAIGTTVGIIVEGIWYATTPVSSAGLGFGLTGTLAATTIAVAGAASLAIAVPLAIYAYRGLINEAQKINDRIKHVANQIDQERNEIFFQLLRLRALKNSEEDFNTEAKNVIDAFPEIQKKDELCKLVNTTYQSCAAKTYQFKDIKATHSDFLRDGNEASLDENKQRLWQQITNDDKQLTDNLRDCFSVIPEPKITRRSEAAFHGLMYGLVMSGSALSISWAFSALIVAAGLSAALPFAGWAVLGGAAIVMGVMFGLGIGIFSQKNIQRDELRKAVVENKKKTNNIANSLKTRAVKLTPTNLNVARHLDQLRLDSTAQIQVIIQQKDSQLAKSNQEATEYKRDVERLHRENQELLAKIEKLESQSKANVAASYVSPLRTVSVFPVPTLPLVPQPTDVPALQAVM